MWTCFKFINEIMELKTLSPPSGVSACSRWGLYWRLLPWAPALLLQRLGKAPHRPTPGAPGSFSHHHPCGLSREGQLRTATALCNQWYNSFLVPQFPWPVPSQEAGTPWHIEGLFVAIYHFQAASFHLHFLTAPQFYRGNSLLFVCSLGGGTSWFWFRTGRGGDTKLTWASLVCSPAILNLGEWPKEGELMETIPCVWRHGPLSLRGFLWELVATLSTFWFSGALLILASPSVDSRIPAILWALI